MNKITLGIVDDKANLLNSLKENLSLFPDIEIIWSANNGIEAVQKAGENPADVILMDIEMPLMDGVESCRRIKAEITGTKIIMLTVFDNSDKIFEAILAGSSGYLLKDSLPSQIHNAIIETLDGGAPMSPIIASKALQLINDLHKGAAIVEPGDSGLGAREMEILRFISTGQNYNEIAERLFISPKTVRNHIQNIYKKLQISSKTEAILLAQKNRWV